MGPDVYRYRYMLTSCVHIYMYIYIYVNKCVYMYTYVCIYDNVFVLSRGWRSGAQGQTVKQSNRKNLGSAAPQCGEGQQRNSVSLPFATPACQNRVSETWGPSFGLLLRNITEVPIVEMYTE